MGAIDKKNKKSSDKGAKVKFNDKKGSDKNTKVKFNDKNSDKSDKVKNVKFNDQKEKSPFEEQNDKLREAILSLGGTKGDIKYLENVDTDTNENLVTDGDANAEVTYLFDPLIYIFN
jgi:hypothetical protein